MMPTIGEYVFVFRYGVELFAAIASILVALTIMAIAMKSGAFSRIRLGNFEIEASKSDRDQVNALFSAVSSPDKEQAPVETDQLAQYYAQVLAQSKFSFWFSLLFASIGFAILVIAGLGWTNTASSIATAFAGVIIDAVAALFFVQSKNAQAIMGDFFDKLRRDRQQAESRRLCESINSPAAKDALRVQLALHYADVANQDQTARVIIDACLAGARVDELGAGDKPTVT